MTVNRVYRSADGVWCSEECSHRDPRYKRPTPIQPVVVPCRFPDPTRASGLVSLLLYRASCDTCGDNLWDRIFERSMREES